MPNLPRVQPQHNFNGDSKYPSNLFSGVSKRAIASSTDSSPGTLKVFRAPYHKAAIDISILEVS